MMMIHDALVLSVICYLIDNNSLLLKTQVMNLHVPSIFMYFQQHEELLYGNECSSTEQKFIDWWGLGYN